jgi:hypothetical protein
MSKVINIYPRPNQQQIRKIFYPYVLVLNMII